MSIAKKKTKKVLSKVVITRNEVEKERTKNKKAVIGIDCGSNAFSKGGIKFLICQVETSKPSLRLNVDLYEDLDGVSKLLGIQTSRILEKGNNQFPLWDYSRYALSSKRITLYPFWDYTHDSLRLNQYFCTGTLDDQKTGNKTPAKLFIEKELKEIVGIGLIEGDKSVKPIAFYEGLNFTPDKILSDNGEIERFAGEISLPITSKGLRLEKQTVSQPAKFYLRVAAIQGKGEILATSYVKFDNEYNIIS